MPLAPSGVRGYPDWQRIENWDSPSRFSRDTFLMGAFDQSPVMDVSNFAYLGGTNDIQGGAVSVLVEWFQDPAGQVQMGQRTFTMSNGIQTQMQYRLVNLGPFCRLSWSQIAGGVLQHTCNLIGTNRAHPCEVIPYQANQFDLVGQAIGAGVAQTQPFRDYCSGPVELSFRPYSGAGFGWTVQLQYLTGGNVWNDFYHAISTGNVLREVVIAPLGIIFAVITNQTGAPANYDLEAVISLTGGS